MNVDFIIVGQGIAGTCFALELLKNKKTFIIIDQYKSNTSSRVALGVYNPLVLKWFTKPWNIDNQLRYFYIFYNEINKFLNHDFFYDIGIYKFLHTPYDQNNWLTKSLSPKKSKYMSSELLSIHNKGLINNKFYGLVKSAGRVDIPLLLDSFRTYCRDINKIIEERFNYEDIIFKKDGSFCFQDIHAKKILFCEGASAIHNPYFDLLNLKPTKGEVLTIYCKDLNLDKIIHSGFLFIPLGDDYYSVGSTYNWKNTNTKCTSRAKKKMEKMLKNTLNFSYEIVDQKASIRPSTEDRRPLIGSHKKHQNMYILNGLGTRGILLAPYLSKCLVDNIYSGVSIDDSINVKRI